MSEIIIVKPEKCVGCNACVRECPAPEANMTKQLEDGRFITMVNPDKCIACGECVKKCNHGARDYIDDTDECIAEIVKEKLKEAKEQLEKYKLSKELSEIKNLKRWAIVFVNDKCYANEEI